MSFHHPWALILIPLVLTLLFWAKRRTRNPGIRFSTGELLRGLHESLKTKLSGNMIFLRGLVSILIILALARPQSLSEEKVIRAEGLDILLAVDVSTSMLAEDFRIDQKRGSRLEGVKEVMAEFIRGRKNDRMGMVVFAARAYTVCPLTRDTQWLLKNLERIQVGMIEDGTALGSGLVSALSRLNDSPSKEKIVILLTDGRNNAGKISPLTAAAAAKALKIKVYTIGAGSKGPAPYPVRGPFGDTIYRPLNLDIDEETLNRIASITDGRYFRATDRTSLREVFKEIDRLEKTPIKEKIFYEPEEVFHLFLIPGLALLFLETLLRNTFLRRTP